MFIQIIYYFINKQKHKPIFNSVEMIHFSKSVKTKEIRLILTVIQQMRFSPCVTIYFKFYTLCLQRYVYLKTTDENWQNFLTNLILEHYIWKQLTQLWRIRLTKTLPISWFWRFSDVYQPDDRHFLLSMTDIVFEKTFKLFSKMFKIFGLFIRLTEPIQKGIYWKYC